VIPDEGGIRVAHGGPDAVAIAVPSLILRAGVGEGSN
jgi:hypothetical protein